MLTHDELKRRMLADPKVREAYDALEEEFSLFDSLIEARMKSGLTQSQVAERMGTKTSAVARLESGGGSKQHSPSVTTLRKYAKAVGRRLEIRLVENRSDGGSPV